MKISKSNMSLLQNNLDIIVFDANSILASTHRLVYCKYKMISNDVFVAVLHHQYHDY